MLVRFKEACRTWSNARSQEAQSVDLANHPPLVVQRSFDRPFYRAFSSMSLQDKRVSVEAPSETPRRQKRVANLPSLSSAGWQTEELPPPPSSK